MRIKNLILRIEAFGSTTPITKESLEWRQLEHLYPVGEDPEQIILLSDISMWDRHPDFYTEFLDNLQELFLKSTLYAYGTQGNQSHDLAAVMVNCLEEMPDINTDELNVVDWHRRDVSCLNPVINNKPVEQPILGPDLMLEINFGDAGGAPIPNDHAVWGYLQHMYSSILPPQKIVLISETDMWGEHPEEYRQFLHTLRCLFRISDFFYIGKSKNYTVPETDEEVDYDAEPVVFWGGSVHTKQGTEEIEKPELPWNFVTHVFDKDRTRKRVNINKVLGIRESQEPKKYEEFVFLHSPEKVARWLFENEPSHVEAAIHIQALGRGYVTRLKQQQLVEAVICIQVLGREYISRLKQQHSVEKESENCMPMLLMLRNVMSSFLGAAAIMPERDSQDSDEEIMQLSLFSRDTRGRSSFTKPEFDPIENNEYEEEKNETDEMAFREFPTSSFERDWRTGFFRALVCDRSSLHRVTPIEEGGYLQSDPRFS